MIIKVSELVKAKGYSIGNIDTVVIAQEPSISPFRQSIQKSISDILGIKENAISIKAKTNEGLGEIGKKEAIASSAVAMLIKGE